MNKKIYLWLTLCLLAVLLAACSLMGSKADVIKCTGTLYQTNMTGGESKWVDGVEHSIGTVIIYDVESNCPELTGVHTVYVNQTGYDPSFWGTYYFESAYDGGGVSEGTFHGTLGDQASGFSSESTSYSTIGSLSGLQINMNVHAPYNSFEPPTFEATIQNQAGK